MARQRHKKHKQYALALLASSAAGVLLPSAAQAFTASYSSTSGAAADTCSAVVIVRRVSLLDISNGALASTFQAHRSCDMTDRFGNYQPGDLSVVTADDAVVSTIQVFNQEHPGSQFPGRMQGGGTR